LTHYENWGYSIQGAMLPPLIKRLEIPFLVFFFSYHHPLGQLKTRVAAVLLEWVCPELGYTTCPISGMMMMMMTMMTMTMMIFS
jgi:hypothetical protein